MASHNPRSSIEQNFSPKESSPNQGFNLGNDISTNATLTNATPTTPTITSPTATVANISGTEQIYKLQESLINSEVQLFNSYQTNLKNILTLHSQDLTFIQKLMQQMSLFVEERQNQIQETQNVIEEQFRKHQELSERHKLALATIADSTGIVTEKNPSQLNSEELGKKELTDSTSSNVTGPPSNVTGPPLVKTNTPQTVLKHERSTGLVYDFAMGKHKCICGVAHSEHPGRLTAIWQRLHEQNLVNKCQRVRARKATHQELLLVHTEEHIQLFTATPKRGSDSGKDIFCSLYCKGIGILGDHTGAFWNPDHSPAVARLACGSLIDLSLEVAVGRIQNGMALIRPPGHHATSNQALGGCFFNNIAVTTKVSYSVIRSRMHMQSYIAIN